MRRVLQILLSWILMLGGCYLLVSGALDYYSSRNGQKEAAASWKEDSPEIPPGYQSLPPQKAPDARTEPPAVPARRGQTVARLLIPRLSADLFVVEGTDHRELAHAPGHMQGTSLPDESGNCIIAGHRDTHFRVLQNIRQGDEIVLESHGNSYRYRVPQLSVISPKNTQCLNPTKEPVLHLITCYPFYYVGSAPKRFVVNARLETAPSSAQSSSLALPGDQRVRNGL